MNPPPPGGGTLGVSYCVPFVCRQVRSPRRPSFLSRPRFAHRTCYTRASPRSTPYLLSFVPPVSRSVSKTKVLLGVNQKGWPPHNFVLLPRGAPKSDNDIHMHRSTAPLFIIIIYFFCGYADQLHSSKWGEGPEDARLIVWSNE